MSRRPFFSLSIFSGTISTPITSLPNRALLMDRLNQSILSAQRRKRTLALLMLDLDREIRDESQEKTLLGVRRSQMQLGALFLTRGEHERVDRVVKDLVMEEPNRIAQVLRLLEEAQDPEYWEFTARGVNFAYLEPERRGQLQKLADQVRRAQSGD